MCSMLRYRIVGAAGQMKSTLQTDISGVSYEYKNESTVFRFIQQMGQPFNYDPPIVRECDGIRRPRCIKRFHRLRPEV